MVHAAMVCQSHYPTDERVRRQAEALVEAGYAVDVISLMKNGGDAKRAEYNGVSIYRIKLGRLRGSKFRYLFEYIYFLIAAGITLFFKNLKKRYQIIHVHNLPNILVFSALVPKLTGAKLVLDMHEIMPEFFMRKYNMSADHWLTRFLKFSEWLSVRLVDHVIVATPFLRNTIIRRSVVPSKCSTILNLPDQHYFKIGKRPADRATASTDPHGVHDPSRFRIIYPGTLNFLHGVDIAIKAIKLLEYEPGLTVELHIYGLGSDVEFNWLKQLVDQLNLRHRVFFHPAVLVEELIEIIHSMDAGIVPKRDGVFIGEAFSGKLFEFAALGIPAIVSRTVGDTYFFDDSMALFFEPENEKDLAGCIIQLARDRSLRQRLAQNSGSVFDKINWNLMRRELCAIYARLLNNQTAAEAAGKIRPLGLSE